MQRMRRSHINECDLLLDEENGHYPMHTGGRDPYGGVQLSPAVSKALSGFLSNIGRFSCYSVHVTHAVTYGHFPGDVLPTILEPEEPNPAVGTSRENLYEGGGEEESYRPGGAARALELPAPSAGGGLNDLSANAQSAGSTPLDRRRARWSYAAPPTGFGERSPPQDSTAGGLGGGSGSSRSPSVRARVSVATASPTLAPDSLLRPPDNYLATRRSSTQSLVEQVRL